MYKFILQNVEGITWYPIISLLLFFAVFTGMLFYVWKMRPSYVQHMSDLPLHDENHDFKTETN